VQVGITTSETSNIPMMELVLKQIDVRGMALFGKIILRVRAENDAILQGLFDTPLIALKKLFE
jgi:hypothetical protein